MRISLRWQQDRVETVWSLREEGWHSLMKSGRLSQGHRQKQACDVADMQDIGRCEELRRLECPVFHRDY